MYDLTQVPGGVRQVKRLAEVSRRWFGALRKTPNDRRPSQLGGSVAVLLRLHSTSLGRGRGALRNVSSLRSWE